MVAIPALSYPRFFKIVRPSNRNSLLNYIYNIMTKPLGHGAQIRQGNMYMNCTLKIQTHRASPEPPTTPAIPQQSALLSSRTPGHRLAAAAAATRYFPTFAEVDELPEEE
jgi:hypothetical protein